MHTPRTVDEWTLLRQKIKQSSIFEPTLAQTIELRCCVALTFLSGVSYALSFLKRRNAGIWIFRRDPQGYCHPNVHTALPIFAVLYVVCDVCAACFLERGRGDVIGPLPILLQQVAAQTLQIFAWLKTWAVLYALPSMRHGILASNPSKARARYMVSPLIFNALNILVLASIPTLQLPWMIALYSTVTKLRTKIGLADLLFEKVVDASTSVSYMDIYGPALQTFLSIADIKREEKKAVRFFRTYIIVTVVWTCFAAIVLMISTGFLLYSLSAQKKFFSSALANRRALQLVEEQERKNTYSHSITSWFLESAPSSPIFSDHAHLQQNCQPRPTFDPQTWRSWIDFANRDDRSVEDVSWRLGNKVNQPNHPSLTAIEETSKTNNDYLTRSTHDNDAVELERHCKFLTIYWHSTLWQTILGMGIICSYVGMQLWIICGMSRSRPQDLIVLSVTWLNWTWGWGGLFLGIFACIVSYASPSPQQLSRDAKPDQSGSKLKLWALKAPAASCSKRGEKLKESNAIKVSTVLDSPVIRGSAQKKELEVELTSPMKISDYARDWSITNSDLTKNSIKPSVHVQTNTGLMRQDSGSSTYSSVCNKFDHTRGDQPHWSEPSPLETEYLDTEQWDTGNFNAIHTLHRGTLRDTRTIPQAY